MKRLCNDLERGAFLNGPSALLSHERLKDAISLFEGTYHRYYPNDRKPYVALKGWFSDGSSGSQGAGSSEEAVTQAMIGPPDMGRVKRSLEDVGIGFAAAVETQADRDAKRRRVHDLNRSHMTPRPDAYAIVLKGEHKVEYTSTIN
jgi:uncharacterized protein (DUF1684 family)